MSISENEEVDLSSSEEKSSSKKEKNVKSSKSSSSKSKSKENDLYIPSTEEVFSRIFKKELFRSKDKKKKIITERIKDNTELLQQIKSSLESKYIDINKHTLGAICKQLISIMNSKNLVYMINPVECAIDVIKRGICPVFIEVQYGNFIIKYRPVSETKAIAESVTVLPSKEYVHPQYTQMFNPENSDRIMIINSPNVNSIIEEREKMKRRNSKRSKTKSKEEETEEDEESEESNLYSYDNQEPGEEDTIRDEEEEDNEIASDDESVQIE